MAALVGWVADELKVGGTANPDMVRVMRDRVAVGTAVAGRTAVRPPLKIAAA